MSLFDYIYVDRSVTLPALPGYTVDLYANSFQTKHLDCFMASYYIKDGALWVKKSETEWVDSEDSLFGGYLEEWSFEILPEKFTGTIVFYDMIRNIDPSNDAWVDLGATFVDGVLKGEIILDKFELLDNSIRKQNEQKWKDDLVARAKLEKMWYFPVVRAKEWGCGQVGDFLFFISSGFMKIGSFVQKLAFKIR